jgi:hypothetical protein
MVGNKSKAHIDSCRGCSPNGVMTHGEGGMLMLKRYVEFKSSVVFYKGKHCPEGDYFIPFNLNAAGDELMMIGRDPRDEDKVVWYLANSEVVNQLLPVGRIKHVALGIRNGMVLTVPFSDLSYTPEGYRSNKSLEEMEFGKLVKQSERRNFAYSEEYLREEKMKVYALGTVPHKWYWFYGWKHMHWYEGNEMVPRTHIFMRLCDENISGANRPGKNRYFEDWRTRA